MRVVSDEDNSSDDSKSSNYYEAVSYNDDVKSLLADDPKELQP